MLCLIVMKAYFDPFKSRLCRNIRNELSKSLMNAIHSGDIGSPYAVAEKYVSEGAEPFINSYINNRIMRYKAIVAQIRTAIYRLMKLILLHFYYGIRSCFLKSTNGLKKDGVIVKEQKKSSPRH